MERIGSSTLAPICHFVASLTQVSTFIYFMGFNNCNLKEREVVFIRDYLSENEILEYYTNNITLYLYGASLIGTQEYLYII